MYGHVFASDVVEYLELELRVSRSPHTDRSVHIKKWRELNLFIALKHELGTMRAKFRDELGVRIFALK